MGKTVVVIPDQHAHPDYNNDRADWLGKLIKDIKPYMVVNLGDAADMASLSSYDKGKATFHGNSYQRDIEAHLDFQERLWHPVKASKKKQPYKVVLHGNHENRLERVLEYDPQLAGDRFGLSFRDFEFERYYDEIIPYHGQTPGVFTFEEVSFAHYFVSGAMGRPVSGEHHAASLLAKNHASCVCGHSHSADFAIRTRSNGQKIFGLVAGVYQDYDNHWAGHITDKWWRGVIILRDVESGYFNPQFVGIEAIARCYGV